MAMLPVRVGLPGTLLEALFPLINSVELAMLQAVTTRVRNAFGNYDLPSSEWMLERMKRTEYSPDAWKLNRYDHQLVFVYGRTMDKHPDSSVMGNEFHVSDAFTTKRDFTMWRKRLGAESFPIALKEQFYGAPLGRIKGELWAMRPSELYKLDTYYENGVYFLREKVWIVIPYAVTWRGEDGETNFMQRQQVARAWMYIGRPEIWIHGLHKGNPPIDGGYHFKPVKMFQPNNPHTSNYYFFTIKEYDNQ